MNFWKSGQLRNLLSEASNGTTNDQVDPSETTVAVTRIETISGGDVNINKVGFVEKSPELENYKLSKGDILFSHINSLPVIGNCALVSAGLNLYSGMNLLKLRPKPTVDARFLHYLLKSKGFRDRVAAYAKPAINQASISKSTLLGFPVSIPPLPTQTTIADYLDRKTAAIDELITKKELLIEELRKYQEAVIAEAVAPREGWRKYKVKQLLKAQPKSNLPSGAGDELGAFPFYVSGAEIKRIAEPMLKGTAILMADGGKASLHLGKGEFSWSDHVLCLLSGDEAVTEFVYNQLSVQLAFLDGHGFRGTGLPMLDKRWLYEDLAIWLPKTRTEILKFNAEILEIRNHYLKRSQNVIATIQELKAYRSALISEAVTGKLPL